MNQKNIIFIATIFILISQCEAQYFRQDAADYAHTWSWTNRNIAEYCDWDTGTSDFEPAAFISQIMNHGAMGWCGNWVRGESPLDAAFVNTSQQARCYLCVGTSLEYRETVGGTLTLLTGLYESEWWQCVESGSVCDFLNNSTHRWEQGDIVEITWRWEDYATEHYLYFVSTGESTGQTREFDACVNAHYYHAWTDYPLGVLIGSCTPCEEYTYALWQANGSPSSMNGQKRIAAETESNEGENH
jgi:hypothetical protein